MDTYRQTKQQAYIILLCLNLFLFLNLLISFYMRGEGGGGEDTLLDLLKERQIRLSNNENGNVANKRERLLVIGRGGFRGGGHIKPQGFEPFPTQRVPISILFKKSIPQLIYLLYLSFKFYFLFISDSIIFHLKFFPFFLITVMFDLFQFT